MSNLIEREKAIRAVAANLMANAILKSADASDNIRDWIPMAEDILSIVPTVDAVMVVRCKDCKWYQPDADKWCGYFECMGFEPDDYCSQGERKDGDRHEG